MSAVGQSRSFDGVCSMSELPSKAEVVPRSCDVAKVPILLRKSVTSTVGGLLNAPHHLPLVQQRHSTRADIGHGLRKTRIDRWWWSSDQLCEPAKVLRDSRECKLVSRPRWATQPKSSKSENTLEMSEQHLHALAMAARLLECGGARERSGDVASILMDAAGDLALG